MTYQAFSSCNSLDVNDAGSIRDFKISIPKDKYITQEDIYFNIEYTNINYDMVDKYYEKLNKECIEEFRNCRNRSTKKLREQQNKLNELFNNTIKDIEYQKTVAKDRQTPLFMFQNIELFVNNVSIACRRLSGLDELIVDDKLTLNQIFPGIKFKYNYEKQLMIRFQRNPMKNKCLKFECHYDLQDTIRPETRGLQLGLPFENSPTTTLYKEYIIPGGFFTGNINIEPDVKSFKMIPCVSFTLYKKFENKDYILESEKLINEYFDKMKLKYYKDGLEISESEFRTSPGLYHIELLNKDEFKDKADFYRINYKIICLC